MKAYVLPLCCLLGAISFTPSLYSQSVTVTARFDTNIIEVGQGTFLRIYAQVVPVNRPNADRIFSWYVDVLNTNASVAPANYVAMSKAASDNDPSTSSTGFDDGANRRGIYDTFLNRPGAGVTNPVELMAIPVTGLTPGQTRFSVQAGSGVPALSAGFIVAPASGGAPWTGGDYTVAFANLEVMASQCAPHLNLERVSGHEVGQVRMNLSFNLCPGKNHFVEYRDSLATGAWQLLPNGPYNTGSLFVTNTGPSRFYRVFTTTPGQ